MSIESDPRRRRAAALSRRAFVRSAAMGGAASLAMASPIATAGAASAPIATDEPALLQSAIFTMSL